MYSRMLKELNELLVNVLGWPADNYRYIRERDLGTIRDCWVNKFTFAEDNCGDVSVSLSKCSDIDFCYIKILEDAVEFRKGLSTIWSYPRLSTEEEFFQLSVLHDTSDLDLDFFLNCTKLYNLGKNALIEG